MKKIVLTDDKLLLYSVIASVILFTYWASYMCWDIFDEFLMVLFAVSLLGIPFVVRAWKKRYSN